MNLLPHSEWFTKPVTINGVVVGFILGAWEQNGWYAFRKFWFPEFDTPEKRALLYEDAL